MYAFKNCVFYKSLMGRKLAYKQSDQVLCGGKSPVVSGGFWRCLYGGFLSYNKLINIP